MWLLSMKGGDSRRRGDERGKLLIGALGFLQADASGLVSRSQLSNRSWRRRSELMFQETILNSYS